MVRPSTVPPRLPVRGASLAAGLVALAFASAGCPKQVQVKDYASPLDGGDGEARSADLTDGPPRTPGPVPAGVIEELRANFEKVYFEYDSADLTAPSRDALDRNARILGRYPSLQVTIEGHCDDRGSTDYNLALGERRARSVMEYLVRLGAGSDQLRLVSYGEERPDSSGDGESAWSRNRRVEFVASESPAR